MAQPYLAHFALKKPPFSKEIPDAELWLPSSKLTVVETLLEARDERASVVLVGEPGVGKTCVLRALRHRIPEEDLRSFEAPDRTLAAQHHPYELHAFRGVERDAIPDVHGGSFAELLIKSASACPALP